MKTYSDIVGDGGSDVLGQVQALHRSIGAALGEVEHLVAVGSGKGGVGKSTVTMALAQAMRRREKDVAILDADFNGPCQARLSGLTRVPWVPGKDGLALPRREDGLGVVSLGSLLEDSRPLGFDSVARGESFTWRATREFAVLGQLLASVDWGRLDVLLLDLPPGAERTLQYAEFFRHDDPDDDATSTELRFVMVNIPSEISRGVVARSLTVLDEASSPVLGVVENMAGYSCHGCGTIQPLFPRLPDDGTDAWGVPTLGRIPFDPALASLCDRGWPAGEADWDSPSLAAVGVVAGKLETALQSSLKTPMEAAR